MPCPYCDSSNIWYAEKRFDHYLAVLAGGRTRLCKECGKKWRLRSRQGTASKVKRELLFVGIAGVVGFGIFFAISNIPSDISQNQFSSPDGSQSSVENVFLNEITTFIQSNPQLIAENKKSSDIFFSHKNLTTSHMPTITRDQSKGIARKARAMVGNNFDPSKLSQSDRNALMEKARKFIRDGEF